MHRKPSYEELEQEVEKLKAKNNTLSKIIESNPHGIALIDNSGQYIHLNRYFTNITGYTLEDIPNKKIWFEKVYPDKNYKKQIAQIWKKDNNKQGMGDTREFKIQCKNGKSKQIEFRSTFLEDQTITVLTDVTQRKKAEKALKESKERLKAIFVANPDPAAVYSNKGYPLYLNDAFVETFGWTLEELQGKRIPFVPKDQKQLAKNKIKEIYTTGHPVSFETQRLSKQGKILDIFLSAAIIKNAKGISNGLFVNLKNISDKKKLEHQLQHAQKMEAIGTLAGGIAHDFNNILFPIMANTEILLMDTTKGSPIHNRLQKIYKSAIRARDLVKQILVFSRQEAIELRTMKLQSIVREALSFIRSAIPAKIEIKHYINKNCSPVRADSTQIHQIVMNLAANASHAMGKKGGQIKLNLKEKKFYKHEIIDPDMKSGSYVCLSISDTGRGMDKELIKQIFDPFFTTREKGRGTGMGLATVHGIVKKMNGFIKVTSKPGKGSTFTIYFPVVKL
ncbi:MAG: PAS domain S-box protein [Desulfobacula sp.]|nr:PAS domain S-box protein [Desulfobacula sp.]